MLRLSTLFLVVSCSFGLARPLAAETIYGLTLGSVFAPASLFSFDSATPAMVGSLMPLSGLVANDEIGGIDFRPSDGSLYGLSARGRIYTLNLSTGAATLVSTIDSPGIERFFPSAMDFNPITGKLHVVNGTDRNLFVDVDTGETEEGGTLAFPLGDERANVDPFVLGLAYTNSVPGATSTTTFGLEASLGFALVTMPSPDAGLLSTVGVLNALGASAAGFDISATTGFAYASLNIGGGGQLYAVDLQTGDGRFLGAIGNRTALVAGLAAAPVPEPSSVMLLATGLAMIGLGATRRLRGRRECPQ